MSAILRTVIEISMSSPSFPFNQLRCIMSFSRSIKVPVSSMVRTISKNGVVACDRAKHFRPLQAVDGFGGNVGTARKSCEE